MLSGELETAPNKGEKYSFWVYYMHCYIEILLTVSVNQKIVTTKLLETCRKLFSDFLNKTHFYLEQNQPHKFEVPFSAVLINSNEIFLWRDRYSDDVVRDNGIRNESLFHRESIASTSLNSQHISRFISASRCNDTNKLPHDPLLLGHTRGFNVFLIN